MALRLITRTHYQVDEPAYLRVLIESSSSPIRSEYSERVAERLVQKLRELGCDFNLPAAKYCVDLARALKVLSENNFWTSSAHVMQLVRPSVERETSLRVELSTEEKLFWFRVFLEHDGAALLFFAREAEQRERIPGGGKDWNDTANEMAVYVYNEYLKILENIRDRAEIRRLLAKRERQPYSGRSGEHQCFIHVNTMARVGLLEKRGREYFKTDATSRLVKAVSAVGDLDALISNNRWPFIVGSVYWGELKQPGWSASDIMRASYEIYARVMETGVSLCPLNTIIETVQIRQLENAETPVSYDECMRMFRNANAQDSKKVRFQVDRMGRPAFIALS
ncbi:MAG: hypothetical protein WD871_08410 [Xanthobacteraceae bacterium]